MPLPVSMDATWMGNVSNPIQFNAQELRRADSAGFGGDGSAFGVRGGIVRHGDNSLVVTVNASDVVTVQPGAVVIPGNSGVGNGCYCSALGAAETGNLTARNATNPRIDLVVYRVLDDDVVTTHDAYTGRIEIIAGVPAASPVAPALPALAVELARITVPASAGGAATVDSTWRTFAAAIGAPLPVTTAARLPANPNAKWLEAFAVDTGREYRWNGVGWQEGPDVFIGGEPTMVGSSPAAGARKIQREGHSLVTPNGSGRLTINYPVAFPNGVVALILVLGDDLSFPAVVRPDRDVCTLAAFSADVFNIAGAAITTQVRVSWIAVGW
jgi:hypothetical protein